MKVEEADDNDEEVERKSLVRVRLVWPIEGYKMLRISEGRRQILM